jgi:multisubunit Na+/H+ antiporter MnhB subunit
MVIATLSVVILQLLFSYLPVSQQLFGLSSITPVDWAIIIVAATPVLFAVEIEKFFLQEPGGTER